MTQIVRFCAVTNNPCGTDTIHNDQPGCACENCRRWCREELVRRWQTADTLRTQLVAWQNMARDNGCQCTPEHVGHALRGLHESNTAAYARIDRLEEEKSRWQP